MRSRICANYTKVNIPNVKIAIDKDYFLPIRIKNIWTCNIHYVIAIVFVTSEAYVYTSVIL